MKNTIIKVLKYPAIFVLIFITIIACDKDFSVLESDVLGEQNLNFKTDTLSFQIAAYNKKLEAIQINGLSSSLLGVYNDPAFGQTIASIVTQIAPTNYNPNFGTNPVIDSVIISIPYFSRVTGTDADGNSTYSISDSLYGKKPTEEVKPFKLTIYQNNYFLRSFDPQANLDETQKYYSKADGSINTTDNFALNGTNTINFDDQKGPQMYSGEVTPSSNPILTVTDKEAVEPVKTYSVPAFRAHLNRDFWKETILDKATDPVLKNANNFNNYFRGLYFKTEAVNNTGSMVLLNLASTSANITIYYSSDDPNVQDAKIQGTYILNFSSGNILNTFINNYNTNYKTALTNINTTEGDEKLYLKSDEGSLSVVDLFSGMVNYTNSNGVTTAIPALEAFKKTYRTPLENGDYKKDASGNYVLKRLINDAQLIVYEDDNIETDGFSELHKYDRIYAYDLKNNIPLVDYNFDPTNTNASTPYFSKIFHLGLRDTNVSTNISKYKIHLTEHLNNILLRDSTNTKIGLVLSNNVNRVNSAALLNSPDDVTTVPATSILLPRGTVLYGTNSNVPNNKKMKLKVYFTEKK